ncbi:MAG: hypothetical protein H7Y42_13450 [Chitinophagaceae bacterium]|nr:hypothetical protein [Chitinophagaceae bacterium]
MQRGKLGMLLAAAAAFGAYKYSKMTPDQKNTIRTRGKDFLDKNLGGLGNLFGKKTTPTPTNGNGF